MFGHIFLPSQPTKNTIKNNNTIKIKTANKKVNREKQIKTNSISNLEKTKKLAKKRFISKRFAKTKDEVKEGIVNGN